MQAAQLEMAQRLKELSYAIVLDPAECFDEHGMPLLILQMPERARRAIAGYEEDPLSFVTKIKFVDKRGAIMDYSKLAGDIPNGEVPPSPPGEASFDWSSLSLADRLQFKLNSKLWCIGSVNASSLW